MERGKGKDNEFGAKGDRQRHGSWGDKQGHGVSAGQGDGARGMVQGATIMSQG